MIFENIIPKQPVKVPLLHEAKAHIDFYEQRYRKGYMNYWPDERQKRIYAIVRSLDLPEKGEALDFGCGNGIFTEVLRRALPASWLVYGVDISATAIQNAGSRYPQCRFFEPGDEPPEVKKFDFIFTHHVLEHVNDLTLVLHQIDAYAKPDACLLHILPCGNPDSFESDISCMRRNGIDPRRGNRFFFEDEGHIRRLTSVELASLLRKHGFSLEEECYSGQYYGAINWITEAGPSFVYHFSDPHFAVNLKSRQRLRQWLVVLLAIALLRRPAILTEKLWRETPNHPYLFLKLTILCFLFPFSKLFDSALKWLAQDEWRCKKTHKNGSEMYLFLRRI
ncbi:MAG: class I SAM-dependent methyltransferase [Thermodesulfobacteriota bacterium]